MVTVNPYGSYRRLRDNAVAAMVGAIEIYNKPRFAYRDECAVILLINAWELLFKAALSKNKVSIYYPKKPGEDYRTVGLTDAVRRLNAKGKWPSSLATAQAGIVLNIEHLAEVRNNSVHFYNAPGFAVVVHSLAQQSIVNFRDFLHAGFGKELADEITWSLMPLGITPPVDPITYLRSQKSGKLNAAVRDMLDKIEGSAKFLAAGNVNDASRLMTQLPVQVVSVKKSKDAAVVVGVDGSSTPSTQRARTIIKRVDPNISHPLQASEVVDAVGPTLHGRRFTSHTLYAIAFTHGLRANPTFLYRTRTGASQWSRDTVTFIKNLSDADVVAALAAYRKHLQKKP